MSIHTVNLSEAEEHLATLIELVEQGEDVVISRDNGRAVKLVIAESPRKQRIAGLGRGKVHMSEDFDAPLGDAFWLGEDQ